MPRKGKFENKSGFQYTDDSIGQLYGTINKALGNCHFNVTSIKTDEVKCGSLSGNMKKGSRIRSGDLVLIEPLTESDTGKYQIVYKYTSKERKILEKEGCLKSVKEKEKEEESEDEAFCFEGQEEYDDNTAVELDSKFIDDI
jgi:initiation factor 1A